MSSNSFQSARPDLEPLLSLRFDGPLLNVETMPIYELGNTLIGWQKIVHKAYLDSIGRLIGGRVTQRERTALALQISNRRNGSDIIDLVRYLATDPFISQITADVLANTIFAALTAIGVYASGNAIQKLRKEENPERTLVFNVYGDVKLIADQTVRDNGVASCEFALPSTVNNNANPGTIVVNGRTRAYIKELSHETVSGARTELIGRVRNYNEQDSSITAELPDTRKVRIVIRERGLYESLRKSLEISARIKCDGRYIGRFGQQRLHFHADSVTKIE